MDEHDARHHGEGDEQSSHNTSSHCCHVHVGCITNSSTIIDVMPGPHHFLAFSPDKLIDTQGPPTPPPTT